MSTATFLLAGALAASVAAETGQSTTSPASMVTDLTPGPSDHMLNPAGMVTMGGVAYFAGEDDANGIELWRSDGTPEGTRIVRDLRAGPGSSAPAYLTPIGNWLYFVADSGHGGVGLWRSDGTALGTELLAQPFPRDRPTQIRAAGGLVVFTVGTSLMVFEEGVGVHEGKRASTCALAKA